MGGTTSGTHAALVVLADALLAGRGGQPFMPRKPLDGREHGARLMMSGGTPHVTAKSAPKALRMNVARSTPDCLWLSQLVSVPIVRSRCQQPALFVAKLFCRALARRCARVALRRRRRTNTGRVAAPSSSSQLSTSGHCSFVLSVLLFRGYFCRYSK